MIPVLTKEQAYKLDKDTIGSGHLTKEQLMDNAGKAVAQFFCEKIKDPFNQNVVVVCGRGNNGGDGVIVHSYLEKYNVSSKIIFTESNHGHSNLIKKYKISKNNYSTYDTKTKFDKYDFIIDGIFGIGLSRDLNMRYKDIINNINKIENIISIDISSGLLCDGTSYPGKYLSKIESKFTLTFGYSKLCHYLKPVNNLFIADIGFKSTLNSINKIEFSDISNILKVCVNKEDIHKYTKGTCQIIAGSYRYPGASILCSLAAQKTGAGYVALFFEDHSHGEDYINKINLKLSDIIVNNYFDNKYKQYIPTLVGPGREKSIFYAQDKKECKHLAMNNKYVIDAGEIYPNGLHFYPNKSIITPHIGEINRLMPNLDICKDIFNLYQLEKIQENLDDKIIILKSFNTFIITKDMMYIMDKGPSILATAGSGDVLSGILVSLLSQGYTRLQASILGTYLHAESANYYAENISHDGITASNLIDCIPYAFNKLREHNVN